VLDYGIARDEQCAEYTDVHGDVYTGTDASSFDPWQKHDLVGCYGRAASKLRGSPMIELEGDPTR